MTYYCMYGVDSIGTLSTSPINYTLSCLFLLYSVFLLTECVTLRNLSGNDQYTIASHIAPH